MSEEKKTAELNDEKLQRVVGGYQVNSCNFDEGDCFEDSECIYKVLHNYINVPFNSFVECLRQDKKVTTIIEEMPNTPVKYLAENCEYLGKNLF